MSAVRDYLDIRDGIPAIHLAMKHGRAGEAYNIASGNSRILKDVLEQLIELSSLTRREIKIKKKDTLIPKDEITAVKLNPSKFKKLTGWKPQIPFRKTLKDILNQWRRKIKN